MKKILVTGANGQLGSELRDIYANSEYELFFLDRKQLPLDKIEIIQDILGMYEPDYIIHGAAYTAVDKAESESDIAYTVNNLATEEIAQYCRIHGAKLIAISTDYVFDGESSTPLKEDAEVSPINTYGDSKLKGEEAIMKWAPDSIIIRTSWVYSYYGNNFVKTMLRLMSEREEISVINDQIGSPTYARDLGLAIYSIIESRVWMPGVYNYSNEGQCTWYEFAKEIFKANNMAVQVTPIATTDYPTPAKRPAYSVFCKQKIKQTFGLSIKNWEANLKA